MAGVVDVFAGAGKVYEFADRSKFLSYCRVGVELVFEPVFNGFDVVVGGFFNVFDGLCICWREVCDQAVKEGARCR